jgi:hypothetical protein
MSHFAALLPSTAGDPRRPFVPPFHVRVDGIVRPTADAARWRCVDDQKL